MRDLSAVLGNPEQQLRFVHIAGTNGKGSVAAMCAAILRQAGLRTGLYTSPHLCRYNERFRINDQEISDDELGMELERVMAVAGEATFFEISTATALCWFRGKQAEIVVWETGLGGRLDATNIVTPLVSVITHIGLDHTQLLGSNLSQIAREKAGIIKHGIPVVIPMQEDEVMDVFLEKAREENSPVVLVRESDLDQFEAPLAGKHQRWNTALAVAATKLVHPALSRPAIRKGLSMTRWPGRCQLVERGGGLPPVLVDGAHNPMGAHALAGEIERCWGRKNAALIFGVLVDKNIPEMAKILRPVVQEVLLTRVLSERSSDLADLARCFPGCHTFSSLSHALTQADRMQHPIVIAGSLFLAGEALSVLAGARPILDPNESLVKR